MNKYLKTVRDKLFIYFSYIGIDACKHKYDRVKDTPQGIGLHIAEGQKNDIRLFLKEIVTLA